MEHAASRRPDAGGDGLGDAAPAGGRRAVRTRLLLRAWAIFFLWIALFSALAVAGGFHGVYRFLTLLVARATAAVLSLLGLPVWANGELVLGESFSLEIIPPCTGLLPTLLYLAAVFAYPCGWRAKALGVALGVPGIFAVNLGRMVSLFLVGHHFPAAFEQAHLLVWQPLIVFSALALWLLWVVAATRPQPPGRRA